MPDVHNRSPYVWMGILALLFLLLLGYGKARGQTGPGTALPTDAPGRSRIDVARPIPRFPSVAGTRRIFTQPDLPEFDRGDRGPSLNRIRHRGQRRALQARQRLRAGRPLLGDDALRRLDDLRRARRSRRILDPREGFVPGPGRVGEDPPDDDASLTSPGPSSLDTGREGALEVIGGDRDEPGGRRRFTGGVIGGDSDASGDRRRFGGAVVGGDPEEDR